MLRSMSTPIKSSFCRLDSILNFGMAYSVQITLSETNCCSIYGHLYDTNPNPKRYPQNGIKICRIGNNIEKRKYITI